MAVKKGPVSSVIVLCSICLIVSILMSLTFLATHDRIEENALKSAEALRKELLPAGDTFTLVTDKTKVEGVSEVYSAENGAGWVVTSSAKGYRGMITVMTGIGSDGKITKVKVTDISEETPGIATGLTQNQYLNQYVGAASISTSKGRANTNFIDTVSGASYSSEAVFSCVSLALMQVQELGGSEL